MKITDTRNWKCLELKIENLRNRIIYEDLAIRVLRIYTGLINGTIKHYRDNAGLECDVIIPLLNGNGSL